MQSVFVRRCCPRPWLLDHRSSILYLSPFTLNFSNEPEKFAVNKEVARCFRVFLFLRLCFFPPLRESNSIYFTQRRQGAKSQRIAFLVSYVHLLKKVRRKQTPACGALFIKEVLFYNHDVSIFLTVVIKKFFVVEKIGNAFPFGVAVISR